MRLLSDAKTEKPFGPNQEIAVARRRSPSALTIQLTLFTALRLYATARVRLTAAPSCWNQIFDLPISASVIPTPIYIWRKSFRPGKTRYIFKNSPVTPCIFTVVIYAFYCQSTSCLYVTHLGGNRMEFDWRKLGVSLYRECSRTPLTRTLFIRIGLAPRVNLSRIL
jgi:hypothetical protein